MFNLSHAQLNSDQRKSLWAQLYQEAQLVHIFDQIGTTNKFYVSFGDRNCYDLSNTAWLREYCGFSGLSMDGNGTNGCFREFITPDNIEGLFEKYKIPREFDYLSIDLDTSDYYVFEAIKNYSPRVVTVEYNSKWTCTESKVIEYKNPMVWSADDFYGASLLALKKLGESKGYTLVTTCAQLDAFFIRNDLLDPDYIPPKIEELLPNPIICHVKCNDPNKRWLDI